MKDQPIVTSLGTFQPVMDSDASAYLIGAEKMGSLLAAVYTINGYRVCASMDPVGKNDAYINHVSVTKDRKHVPSQIAINIARALVPSVINWDVDIERATHCWERE